MSTLRKDWFIPIVLLSWGDMGLGLLAATFTNYMEKNILKTEAKPS